MKHKFKFLIIALLSIVFFTNATACEKEQTDNEEEEVATGAAIILGAYAVLVIGCIFAGSFDD